MALALSFPLALFLGLLFALTADVHGYLARNSDLRLVTAVTAVLVGVIQE